jgi:hypothetical protein
MTLLAGNGTLAPQSATELPPIVYFAFLLANQPGRPAHFAVSAVWRRSGRVCSLFQSGRSRRNLVYTDGPWDQLRGALRVATVAFRLRPTWTSTGMAAICAFETWGRRLVST